MAMKRALDQTSAWILAVIATGAVFGAGLGVAKVISRRADVASDEGEHGEGHGEEHHGEAHDEENHGEGHAEEKHGEGHGDEKHGEGHGDEKHGESHDGKHGESHDGKHGESHDGKHGESHDGKHGEGHGEEEHGEEKHGEGHGAEGHGKDHGGAKHGDSAEPSAGDHGAEPAKGGHEKHPKVHDEHTETGGETTRHLAAGGEGEGGEQGQEAGSSRHREGPKQAATASLPTWDYKGSSGPQHWGELSEAYSLCGQGKKQSPIDIEVPPANAKLLPLKFHYQEGDAVVKNDGHTVLVAIARGSSVAIEGESFALRELSFHAPSEHKISGSPYDLELQLLHRSDSGQVAMISVLYEEGQASKSLAKLWSSLPDTGETLREPLALNPANLLPSRQRYFHYQGSLTTPPCSEGVKWYVLTEPVQVSSKQLEAFAHVVPFNSRPVQPLAGRSLVRSAR